MAPMQLPGSLHLILSESVWLGTYWQSSLPFPFDISSLFNTFLTAIVVLGLFVVVITYLNTPDQKAVDWKLISDEKLLTVGGAVRKRVQIFLDNKPVSDLCLVLLKVWNSGNVPIEVKDYEKRKPIKFSFGEKAEVLDAEILDTTSSEIREEAKSTLKRDSRSVALGPLLMKSRDEITFKVLLTKHTPGIVEPSIRISGIKQIKARGLVLQTSRKSLLLWGLIFILGGQASGYLLQWYLSSTPIFNKPGFIFFILHGVVLFLKNLAVGVLLFYGRAGLVASRGGMLNIKTMRGAMTLWVINSVVLTTAMISFGVLMSL